MWRDCEHGSKVQVRFHPSSSRRSEWGSDAALPTAVDDVDRPSHAGVHPGRITSGRWACRHHRGVRGHCPAWDAPVELNWWGGAAKILRRHPKPKRRRPSSSTLRYNQFWVVKQDSFVAKEKLGETAVIYVPAQLNGPSAVVRSWCNAARKASPGVLEVGGRSGCRVGRAVPVRRILFHFGKAARFLSHVCEERSSFPEIDVGVAAVAKRAKRCCFHLDGARNVASDVGSSFEAGFAVVRQAPVLEELVNLIC